MKNKQLIQEGVKNLLRFTTDKWLSEFGTNFDQKFALVPDRVLNAPTISYHSRSSSSFDRSGRGILDRQGGQYSAKLRAQESETEHIDHMKDWDGISDGQFDPVLREELSGIEGLRRPSKWIETTYNVHRCHQAPSHKIIRK
ncbi:hypothetical protein G9A89_011096 [Geosiphon pyriformis]|nr:hypothetical protein G9A89_011096 [Geosiphon pyriformis]